MTDKLTCGVHHVGLAVADLAAAQHFFCELLGWEVVGGRSDYPAVFVSDGFTRLTLWRVADPANAVPFNRRTNIGLHHLALAVADDAALEIVFERLNQDPEVTIEFAPEAVHPGSGTRHFICAMPGGLRIEFATIAR